MKSKFIDSRHISLHASNSTKAWEIINETFVFGSHKKAVFKGHSQYIYDCVLTIDKPEMDPGIDIFKYFHYSQSKWVQLIKNYLDIDKLKDFKKGIPSSGECVLAYSFTNSHSNGKNCLLSMICSRRADKSLCLTFFLRASEVTKRLLIDLVLFQRLGEYLFDGKPFKVVVHTNYFFQDDPVLLMYTVHKKSIIEDIKKELTSLPRDSIKGIRCIRLNYLLDTYNRLKSTKNLGEIKYKIYKRVLKVVNPKIDPAPVKPLLVKDLTLDKYLSDN